MKGATILFARAVYAINWFYLAPEIPNLISEYHQSYKLAGIIPLSFFLGSGLMQLPASYIGTKIGQRNSIVLGLLLMSLSSFLVAFSSSLTEVLVYYFLGGVGASFFFSSGGSILSVLNKERVGLYLGVYNALFSVGGFIGLNWVLVFRELGFSNGVALVGALDFLSALLNLRLPNYTPSWKAVKDKGVVLLGVATVGVWGIYYAVGELFPSFMFFFYHVRSVTASEVTSSLLIFSAIGGAMGWLGDKFGGMKVLLSSSIVTSLSLLFLYTPFYELGLAILGISNELAISVLYSITALRVGLKNSSVTLAMVNSINISLGTWLEFVAGFLGYYSWATLVVLSLLPLLLLLNLRTRT
ncbi:MFS transporter [Metallosphaera tengchongensis]|uniref:MFS transporter n=1 Tax=Metallosphaera tengchongensis TaxID=1532350 RepID=A0A6N0NU43_9CREN|nr:MFS transporter [Metallosphaera tengchongensis]QKR00404.1 MFS transporter [Metallosphaera tengchongensis]